jgi:hypothetical protein
MSIFAVFCFIAVKMGRCRAPLLVNSGQEIDSCTASLVPAVGPAIDPFTLSQLDAPSCPRRNATGGAFDDGGDALQPLLRVLGEMGERSRRARVYVFRRGINFLAWIIKQ